MIPICDASMRGLLAVEFLNAPSVAIAFQFAFRTHRHQFRRPCPGGRLPAICSTRGKVRAAWCAGAVGAFSNFRAVHSATVGIAQLLENHHKGA